MNYTKIYNNLIEISKNKHRYKSDKIYFEKHHILPVSWGGSDESFNLVLLTAKEHWIAHLLLARIATGNNVYKANQAIVNMGRVISEYKRKTSTLYAISRKNIASEVSKRHTNTLIVQDVESGIRIGRVSKNHPKVLSGKWVFFHIGMTRSEEFKLKVGASVSGEKNGTFTGMTNEQIIFRCEEVFEKYKYWNYNITRLYCMLKYDEKIPTSFGGKYRESVTTSSIHKILKDNFGVKETQIGSFAKHHTNKIKEEIENEFKN